MDVTLKGYVRHNGEKYGPGDVITGLSEKEVERLELAEVVDLAIDEDPADLSKLTVPKLKELAKAKEIEGYDNMKKDELIAALTPAGDE